MSQARSPQIQLWPAMTYTAHSQNSTNKYHSFYSFVFW